MEGPNNKAASSETAARGTPNPNIYRNAKAITVGTTECWGLEDPVDGSSRRIPCRAGAVIKLKR